MGKIVLMLALGLATATAANASVVTRDFGNTRGIDTQSLRTSSTTGPTSTSSAVSAPEIDPAGMLSGMTLLLGGLAVLRGRRKS